jgi:hypothetical protein
MADLWDTLTGPQRQQIREAHAENEAKLVTRRISPECDKFHADAEDSGCENLSCQCWCH